VVLLAPAAVLALLALSALPAAAEGPTAITLPTPGGANGGAAALDVNPAGVAVGRYSGSGFLEHAVVWAPVDRGGYVAVDLNPAGAFSSAANAINPAGRIVGWATSPQLTPEVWDPDGRGGHTAFNLRVPVGMSGQAAAINARGVIAGWFGDDMGAHQHPAVWRPNKQGGYGPPEDLGAPAGYPSAVANGINSAGAVVGRANSATFQTRGVVWARGDDQVGSAVVLGPLPGGTSSLAADIDAAGVVAGSSDGAGVGGAVWRPDARGGYRPAVALPSLPGGTFASIGGMSAAGVIAGTSDSAGFVPHATIWLPVRGGYQPADVGSAGSQASASSGEFVAGGGTVPNDIFMQATLWRLDRSER
jgi:uncharacterized membrane protein